MRHDMATQGKIIQHKSRQDNIRQGKARQDKSIQDNIIQDKTLYGKGRYHNIRNAKKDKTMQGKQTTSQTNIKNDKTN